MNTHTSYTDMYSADENYATDQGLIGEGNWDDILSPDEYEDILDQKRFNQSMGQPAWHNIRTNTHKKGQK